MSESITSSIRESAFKREHTYKRRIGRKAGQISLLFGRQRALETRSKCAVGITLHELITATRLAKAKRELRETNLTLDRIANRCSLECPEYLSVLFWKHRNMTPREYHEQHRQK
ncbi:helix-turn-helix domain-containing protein [Rubripirellula tenax]|uniref:helix-turn-helix domain-containing protein n=1 Tax=Rubripirellula tenax TaxID=2528015 RepID=UPI0011B3E1E2